MINYYENDKKISILELLRTTMKLGHILSLHQHQKSTFVCFDCSFLALFLPTIPRGTTSVKMQWHFDLLIKCDKREASLAAYSMILSDSPTLN